MRRTRLAALLLALALPLVGSPVAAQPSPEPVVGSADTDAAETDRTESDAWNEVTTADAEAVRLAYTRLRSSLFASSAIRTPYEARDWRPHYATVAGLTPRGRIALEWLPSVVEHGVDPDWLGLDEVRTNLLAVQAGGTRAATAAANLEIRIADALVRAASELRLDNPTNAPADLRHDRWRNASLRALLDAETDELQVLLAELPPRFPSYVDLVDALAQYRAIAEAGGWPSIDANQGDDATAEQLAPLRARLAIEGYLPAGTEGAWDDTLRAALTRFQQAHQLTTDGVLGRRTRAALNEPVRDRIAALIVALDKMRESPAGADGQPAAVRVNAAGQYAEYWEYDQRIYRGRAVVGRTEADGNPENHTPTFSDQMERLELNPFWYPPPRLERELRADPELGIVRRGGHLVQLPGPNNRLGRVKFLFPNTYDVYLHDTSNPELFERPLRAYSAGCIRIENPLDLATIILSRDQQRDADEVRAWIDGILQSTTTEVVHLHTPLPVHIEYYLAHVADDGITEFYRDLYDRDTRLLRDVRRRANVVWELDQGAAGSDAR